MVLDFWLKSLFNTRPAFHNRTCHRPRARRGWVLRTPELLEQRLLLTFDPSPSVQSIAFAGYPDAVNVNFTVTFSEPVKNVGTGDFRGFSSYQSNSLDPGPPIVAVTPISPVNGAAAVFTVTVSSTGAPAAGASLGLKLVDDNSIRDLSGNALVRATNQPVAFDDKTLARQSNSIIDLKVADINGDGKPDLVTAANYGTFANGSMAVNLGNGDGSFQTTVINIVGRSPTELDVADVDRDGKPDVIVANSNSSFVSVLRGNGNGTFQSETQFTIASRPAFLLSVADVNRDGRPDLVVGRTSGVGPQVFLGNGDTFGTAQDIDIGVSGSSGGIIDLLLSNVISDSTPDLIVSDNGNVHVLRGFNGSFLSFTSSRTGNGTASSLAVADVNGDGVPDIVYTYSPFFSGPGFNQVGVLLGNSSSNGTFEAQRLFQTASSGVANGVAVADINGDGKPDLVASNFDSETGIANLSVLLGNGNGTFQSPRTFGSYDRPRDVAVADLNGDGRPDLVAVTSSGVEVLLSSRYSNGRFDGDFSSASVSVPPPNTQAAPAITSASIATFTAGVPGSFTVVATGSPQPTLSIAAGTLPAGLTFVPSTGLLSGTVTDASAITLRFVASNGVSPDASQNFTLMVTGSSAVTAPVLTIASSGAPLTQTNLFFASAGDGQIYEVKLDANQNVVSSVALVQAGAKGKSLSAVTLPNGAPVVFLIGNDNQVYRAVFNASGTLTSGFALTQAGAVQSMTATTDADGNPLLLVIGSDSQVYFQRFDANGNQSANYALTSGGAVKSLSASGPTLFVQGLDDQLYQKRFNGITWGGYNLPSVGAVNTYTFSAASGLLLGIGSDDQLYAQRIASNGTSSGWFLTAAGGINAVVQDLYSGKAEAFVLGVDNQVYVQRFDASGNSLGYAATTVGAVKYIYASGLPGSPGVFAVGMDNQVYKLRFDNVTGNVIGGFSAAGTGPVA